MNVASLGICKELYELSGWETGRWYRLGGINPNRDVPKYDLSYLMQKLPKYINHQSMSCRIGLYPQGFTATGASKWCATYETYRGEIPLLQADDTPEDAACKLAIELFKQGVLKRGN